MSLNSLTIISLLQKKNINLKKTLLFTLSKFKRDLSLIVSDENTIDIIFLKKTLITINFLLKFF